jgi:hypothetical protein
MEGLQFDSRITAVKHFKLTKELVGASKRTRLDLADEEGLARQLAELLWQKQLNNITLIIRWQVVGLGMLGDHSLASGGLVSTDLS